MYYLYYSIQILLLSFLLVKSSSLRNRLCISDGSFSDCICLTFNMMLGVRQIKFLDKSFGAFLTMSTISVVVRFNVSFNVVFNILVLNVTILCRLFFPSTASGKNIFPGLPRTINLASLFRLNFIWPNHFLREIFFFLLHKEYVLFKLLVFDGNTQIHPMPITLVKILYYLKFDWIWFDTRRTF